MSEDFNIDYFSGNDHSGRLNKEYSCNISLKKLLKLAFFLTILKFGFLR